MNNQNNIDPLFFSSILNSISDPVFVKDASFQFIYTNDALCKMLGMEKENIIGKTLNEDLPKAQTEHFTKIDKIVIDSGQENTSEEKLTGKDGKILDIITKKTRYIDEKGNKFIVGVIRDVTDKKKAEELLRKNDDKFRKLTENIPGLVFQFTRRLDGTYIVPIASSGIKEIFGCSPEDVANDFAPISKVIFPEDSARVIGDIETSAKNLNYFTCEFRVQIHNKPIQWIYSSSKPEKLEDGSITWYGYNYDITERKQAEETIQEKIAAMEKMNQLMVGRELKMVELKKEIEESKKS